MLRLPSRQLLRGLRGSLGFGGEEALGSNPIIVTTSFSTFSTPTPNSLLVSPTHLFIQHGGSNRKQTFSSEQIIEELKLEENASENNTVEGQPEKAEQKAVTLAGLLELSQRKKLHHKTALYFVANMAKLKNEGLAKEADYKAGLHAVLKQLEGDLVKDMQPLALLSCLKGLTVLGVEDDHAAVKNLENSLVWLSRACPIKELTMMLSFSISRKRTDSQKVLFSEVCKALERRWVEIKGASALVVQAPSDNFWVLLSKAHFNTLVSGTGKDLHKPLLLTEITDGKIFCGLLRYSDQFSPQFLAKLEDRLAELSEDFPPAELAAILKALAVSKRRNVPLLKALTFYLTKHRGLLDIKQLADALFSLKQLSFKDPVTLEKICSELEVKVVNTGEEGGAVLRSILTSLGQLRYLSTGLIDAICSWYQGREKVEERDMVALLVTLSNLNYKSPRHTEMLQKFASSLEPGQFRHLNRYEMVWLDVVWAMVALDLANHSHLDSVLNSSFHNLLLYSGENKNMGASIKLLNINAAAKLLHPDYRGPVLNVEEDPLLRDLKISPGLAKVQLRQKVLEAFASIAPPPRFLNLDVNSLLGCQIDGELVCDTKGSPLPVVELTTLPEGTSKVALMVASFQDCLINGSEAGATALNVRLLQADGYKVMMVRHDMLQPDMTVVARVKFLELVLQNALGISPEPIVDSSLS